MMLDGLETLRVRAGEVIAYRLFDIAFAIDLARADAIWSARPGAGSARKRLSATSPKALAYDVPPLMLAMEPVQLELPGGPVQARVTARLYDFGVLTLAVGIPARELSWNEFSELLNAVNQAVGPDTSQRLWSGLTLQLLDLLDAALERPTASGQPKASGPPKASGKPASPGYPAASGLEEDYIVGLVQSFDRPVLAADILDRLDLVPLLSGDRLALSEGARQDLLRKQFSYYTDDLVVLTWDRAFIYEPRGDSDVLDVLEVANAQLLEMRYYDELLDDELPRMYGLVETTQRSRGFLSSRRFAGLARRLYMLVAEVTELTEKVDNAMQVTEDVYLARIYTAALDLFRVSVVSAAVDRKLAIIRDTYAALYEEASGGRAALMEMAIVVLIVVEIMVAIVRH